MALERVEREGRVLVVLDEIVFTKRSLQARDYSARNTNLSVDQTDVYAGYRKVIATVTEAEGVGYTQILAEGIDGVIFRDFLKKLRARMGTDPIALFMD